MSKASKIKKGFMPLEKGFSSFSKTWMRIYSVVVRAANGNNDIVAAYFLVMMSRCWHFLTSLLGRVNPSNGARNAGGHSIA